MFSTVEKKHIAQRANALASQSFYRGSAPRLYAKSQRRTLLAWLKWADPNGVFSDRDARAEGLEPLTLTEAWEMVLVMVTP